MRISLFSKSRLLVTFIYYNVITLKYIKIVGDDMKGEKRKYTTITIPTALFENIKKEIKTTGFSSVSDYATYILRETTSELAMGRSGVKSKSAIADKLRALGYIQ